MFPLKSFYLSVVRFKNRSDAAGGCPQSFCFFFEYLFSLLQRKKYFLVYLIILFVPLHYRNRRYGNEYYDNNYRYEIF